MTQFSESRPPALALRTNWPPWGIFWLLGVAAVAVLLGNDARLDTHFWLATRWAMGDGDGGYYKWVDFHAANAVDAAPTASAARPFYFDSSPPMDSHFYRDTAWLWKTFKLFGSVGASLLGVAAVAAFARPRWVAGIGAATGLALGNAPEALAFLFGRDRPTHHDGVNHWDFFRGLHDSRDLSFPSGHATSAFALAAVLAVYFPKSRWLMIPLAAACAFSRVVMEAHFYSDIIAGGMLGWTCGWFATRATRQVIDRKALPGQSANI